MIDRVRSSDLEGDIWSVDEVDLKGKGVIFKGDLIHSPVCRMAVCLDSEGNSILLHQLKPK
jgi:predicted enzyme related to lactoylglutathione lyase